FQAIGDVGKFLNRVLQLVGQLFIPEQLARGAVAGIHFIDDLVGFNDGLVGILHEGVILHQQTQVAFAAAKVVNYPVKIVSGIPKLVGQLLISQELAHGALTSAHVIQQDLDLVENSRGLVDQGRVGNDLAQAAFAVLHVGHHVIQPLYQYV